MTETRRKSAAATALTASHWAAAYVSDDSAFSAAEHNKQWCASNQLTLDPTVSEAMTVGASLDIIRSGPESVRSSFLEHLQRNQEDSAGLMDALASLRKGSNTATQRQLFDTLRAFVDEITSLRTEVAQLRALHVKSGQLSKPLPPTPSSTPTQLPPPPVLPQSAGPPPPPPRAPIIPPPPPRSPRGTAQAAPAVPARLGEPVPQQPSRPSGNLPPRPQHTGVSAPQSGGGGLAAHLSAQLEKRRGFIKPDEGETGEEWAASGFDELDQSIANFTVHGTCLAGQLHARWCH